MNRQIRGLVLLTLTLFSMTAHASKQQVIDIVVDEAERQGLDVSLALAVAQAESNFKPDAISSAGAIGVMQIMPHVGKQLFDLTPSDLADARTNVRAGVTFLDSLLKRYGNVEFALSHYNGGSRVRGPDGSFSVIPATKSYVATVLRLAETWGRREWRGKAEEESNIIEQLTALASDNQLRATRNGYVASEPDRRARFKTLVRAWETNN